MSRLQRIRKQAMSLRGGLAVGGALAIAVSLTQVAGTLAATDLEPRTAKVPIATANYYPTPLTSSVTCETTYTGVLWGRRAKVSWAPVPGATGYRVDLVHSNTGEVKSEFVTAPTTQLLDVIAPYSLWSNWDYLIRVRTINGPAVSSGYTTAPQRARSESTTTDRTECGGSSGPNVGNAGWENSESWSPPEVGTFGSGQPQVNALGGLGAEANVVEDELAADATLAAAAARTSETSAPAAPPVEAMTATASTSTPVPRTSSSTSPTAAPAERSTTSSSSTRAPTTTSTTATTAATPVALPGGGEATLVGGTTLVISDDEGQVCSATVREGSALKVRSGVLEVTDARETREVDPETCELT